MLKLLRSDTIFPVPLLTFEMDGADALNLALRREIAVRAATEPSVQRSNRGGWHSASDLFLRSEEAHRALAEAFEDAARQATAQWVQGVDIGGLDLVMDGWINVGGAGDYNSPHDHPNAFWSGVYYVACPASEGEGDAGGTLELLSGRAGNVHAPLASVPMTWDYLRVTPKEGVALLFPGHLKHWVTPSRQPGERISIAFNAAFRPRA